MNLLELNSEINKDILEKDSDEMSSDKRLITKDSLNNKKIHLKFPKNISLFNNGHNAEMNEKKGVIQLKNLRTHQSVTNNF